MTLFSEQLETVILKCFEKCKHVVKEKKMPDYITDKIEISSDDSDREGSDEENSDKENSDQEN